MELYEALLVVLIVVVLVMMFQNHREGLVGHEVDSLDLQSMLYRGR